jgi:uncharacterized protein YukE
MATLDTLENRVINIEKSIKGLTVILEKYGREITSKASSTDLSREVNQLRELISSTAGTVNDLQAKLAKVILPEETRYYLEGNEVESFQSNFNKLKAMMTQFEKLYRNLVAYEAKLEA